MFFENNNLNMPKALHNMRNKSLEWSDLISECEELRDMLDDIQHDINAVSTAQEADKYAQDMADSNIKLSKIHRMLNKIKNSRETTEEETTLAIHYVRILSQYAENIDKNIENKMNKHLANYK